MKKAVFLLLSLSTIYWMSCGGGGGGTPTPPAVTISISPTTSSVEITSTAQFTATVRNATNAAVTWRVNDVDGGNSTVGTISATGLYTAPGAVPSPGDVTVKAVAQADTSKSASAAVSVKLRITVTPATADVPAVGTQQFTALVEGVTNTDVTWQVNGVAGGNSTVGTISAGGLYTAPVAIPAGGTVSITAVAQADTSRSDTAGVSVFHSNAMLSGRYALSYLGWDPCFFVIAGSFNANGNGTITSGLGDLNNCTDVFPAITLTGSYSVSADGRVEILLNDSLANDYTLHAVMISPDRLRLIQFDTFATGQGQIDKQDPTAFSNAAFTGGYAFRLEGFGFTGSGWMGAAGRMSADGAGNLSAGVMDVNEDYVDTNAVAFTGTYDIAASGRGTATLDTPLGFMNFALYMVSANKANVVSLDLVPWTLGKAEKQTLGSFSNANLTGDYAYIESGTSALGLGTYFNAGRFTANGSGAVSAGVSDENDNGVPAENLAFTGTYAVAANGRGTGSFTATRGTSDFSFYLVSPTRAVFVQQGAFAVATGEIEAQSGPFSNGSLTGDYGISFDGWPSMTVGQFTATGAGAASGTVDINTYDSVADAFVLEPNQAFTATYSVTANGRGNYAVADASGPLDFHVYVISDSKVIIIGMDEVLSGAAEKQF